MKEPEHNEKTLSGSNEFKHDKISDNGEDSINESIVANRKWKEHLDENRSTIVDLFHGQLRRTLRCQACGHKTLKFEVFHCLSVALKAQFAYNIILVFTKKVKFGFKEYTDTRKEKRELATGRTAYGGLHHKLVLWVI